jgi:hypothetical protein
MKRYIYIIVFVISTVMTGCSSQVPGKYQDSSQLPHIFPDYINVTVPFNIASLHFEFTGSADDMVSRYTTGDKEYIYDGIKSEPSESDWKEMTEVSKGKSIKVEVFIKNNGKWIRYKPFNINVAVEPIDPYISYRLIAPSYVTYEELTINQRCLENYDESVIYDNMLCSDEKNGQCINCHNYQNYNPQRMQFHARQANGGTIVTYDGKIKKVNMKNNKILSAGVYPSWHPWLKLIAYSVNKTGQSFHTRDLNKIEVEDAASDLIVYDLDKNKIMPLETDPTEFSVFPFWAPDGKYLYYCCAHFEYKDTISHEAEAMLRYKEIKYNIYRMPFDEKTYTFGSREMVFDAAGIGKSATFPRISPDGRFLMFTLGGWGCFHIWHRDADLWIMDLKTMKSRPMVEVNSKNTESYHSWSSNGRWIIFSTRRDDGGYTRPYIAYVDKKGIARKPFELPQDDPDYHHQFMKSYNIPEFMKGPVTIKPQQFADVLKTRVDSTVVVKKLK